MWNSKLVILDEPTAALGVAQTEQVLELVRRLAEQGLAVVLISHNLHDIFETATRITVLRLGRNVGIYERATTTQQEVVHAITAGIPTKVAGLAPSGRRGGRMSTVDVAAPGLGGRRILERAEGIWQRTIGNLKSGNLGVLPVVLGELLIVGFFSFTATNFFTAGELRERHPADGGRDDDRVRRRLRAAARGDRSLGRLSERHRRGDCGRRCSSRVAATTRAGSRS